MEVIELKGYRVLFADIKYNEKSPKPNDAH